jgi:hypothetical protein
LPVSFPDSLFLSTLHVANLHCRQISPAAENNGRAQTEEAENLQLTRQPDAVYHLGVDRKAKQASVPSC